MPDLETPLPPSADAHMMEALALARAAAKLGEVPVGAVVVHQGNIIGRGHNRREIDADPLAHAELLAIGEAARKLGRWRLSECTLFCTLEPCTMCAGALVNARVQKLVYAAADPKAGAVESLAQVCTDDRLNHRVEVHAGLHAEEAGDLLRTFFRDLRRREKP
jgi:tRNA(adenine34) deaminase